MTQEQANWLVTVEAAHRVGTAEAQSRSKTDRNDRKHMTTTTNNENGTVTMGRDHLKMITDRALAFRTGGINIGDAVETVRDCRQIGGTICRINTGVVERITTCRIVVRNEHGNLQNFSILTHNAIPQIDQFCRSFFRKL